MSEATRRDFLKTASAGLLAATTGNAVAGADKNKGAQMTDAPAFAQAHEPKPLPFDASKLKGLSEKLIKSHWENNYGGSVKTLNGVKQRLAAALADKDSPPFLYGDLKREHLMRTGSVVLHELYFGNLGGNGNADADLRKAIGLTFGDFSTWETEFRKIAASLGGGPGWVVLGHNLHTGQIENYWQWDHMYSPAATMPLLVMDMYEHSYAIDYGAAAAKYIDAFFENIHWEVVAARSQAARAFKPAAEIKT